MPLSPSGPNTNDDPATEKSSNRLITPPSVSKIVCPTVVLRTNSAKRICSVRPQPTVLRSIAPRLFDSRKAISMMTISPTNDCTRGRPPKCATAASAAAAATPTPTTSVSLDENAKFDRGAAPESRRAM